MTLLRFESAASGSAIQPADSSPAESSNVVALTDGTGRSVGQRILSAVISILIWPYDFVVALFGFEIIEGAWCPDCVDVHQAGEQCPRAIVADCDICLRTVDVDAFGNCINSANRYRNHKLRNRRSKPLKPATSEVITMTR